ncbi:tRNA A37 threonylcarbamoyladenosine synthetase subunit TsaC/SUA5/YrdC [Pelomonas aquatica]|uniref:tRNA A37 threonylcarbamoyladenosine synthetase subunit TsaC/SUA5/YrdC n=1 Tax=Pelomonas aquatica TaxID=431058 RepID=A0ABU1Z6S2_9BURK|nr:Sua5/YciO/YrdC/YwlC family protein [Pelomonas aquatica]MDR7296317.1 tRNA A37 threonylcarbamoyladenosine synthetase subunit TsaC/SUA5/YrdC [Pelomonas aquatica]
MSRFLRYAVHPDNPQPRLLMHAAAVIRAGGVAVLPTAAGYLLACRLDDKTASTKLRRLAGQSPRDAAVLLCRDVAQAAVYVRIDDAAFRAIRRGEPGAATLVLPCTKRVPHRLSSPRAMAVLYFGGHAATQGLLAFIDEALLLSPPADGAATVEQLAPAWRDGIDLALDVGPLFHLGDAGRARPAHVQLTGARS